MKIEEIFTELRENHNNTDLMTFMIILWTCLKKGRRNLRNPKTSSPRKLKRFHGEQSHCCGKIGGQDDQI